MKALSYNIKVTSVTSNQTKTFTTLKACESSTGITAYYLEKIRAGQHSNLIRGKKDILFKVEFLNKPKQDVVAMLYPNWDTSDCGTQPKECFSHGQAIALLSEGTGSTTTKKSTYDRRRNMQPLGEPCKLPIKDGIGREWILVCYHKGEFITNKK